MLFDGSDISTKSSAERVRRGLVLVPEGRQIFAGMTVHENLQLGAYRGELKDRICICRCTTSWFSPSPIWKASISRSQCCYRKPIPRAGAVRRPAGAGPLRARERPLRLACHGLVLQFERRVVLIDTCVGCHKPPPIRATWHRREDNRYIEGLRGLGLVPEDVDTVLCTHLHADHVGWNTRLVDGIWVPTFPRARYLIGRTEMEYWNLHGEREGVEQLNHGAHVDSVLPVVAAGQVDLVDDGFELARGLVLRPLHGHTPGQMGLYLDRGATRAVFCGDAVHLPVQILRPDWSTAFCTEGAAAAATRRGSLAATADADRLLVPAHFGAEGFARVRCLDAGYLPVFGRL